MFCEMGRLSEPDVAAFREAAIPPLEHFLADGTYRGWFALTPDGKVTGGVGVQLRPLLPRPDVMNGTEAIVLNMYVEPPYRRRGVARALLRTVLDWCHAQGIRRIVLHPSPSGQPLYESLSFAPSGELIYKGPPPAGPR
jgi:GNAT superfamily N-acetyltransferase